MKKSKEELKTYFETGDKPTQQNYADLIDSFVDAKQPVGEANRSFVIDANGDVSVAVNQPVPEYTLSDIVNNKVSLLKDGVVVKEIDLQLYVDDTNLARLVSGTVDANGIATFARDDDSEFTVDFSALQNVATPTLQQVTGAGSTTSINIRSSGFSTFSPGVARQTAMNKDGFRIFGTGINQTIYSEGYSSVSTGTSDLLTVKFPVSDMINNPNGNQNLYYPYKSGVLATLDDALFKIIDTADTQTSALLNTQFPEANNPVGTAVLNTNAAQQFMYIRVSSTNWKAITIQSSDI